MLADATLANDSCRRWRRRRRSSPRPTKALLTTRSCRRRARPARGRRFQGSSKRITTLFCNRNRGPHLPAAAGSTGQVRPTSRNWERNGTSKQRQGPYRAALDSVRHWEAIGQVPSRAARTWPDQISGRTGM